MCTENIVERMLKMHIDVIKRENNNVSVSPLRSQISKKSRKMNIFEIFFKILIFFENFVVYEEALYESSVRKLG